MCDYSRNQFLPRAQALVRAFICAATFALGLCTSSAATLTVTSTNDNGSGSLREAIQNATAGDVINFAVRGEITLTNGELVIGTSLTISGPGWDLLTLRRSSAPETPKFRILNSSADHVNISGVTISNGRMAGENGASYYPSVVQPYNWPVGGSGSPALGGAIIQRGGTLSLLNCCISSNTAVAGTGGTGSSGGAGSFADGGAIWSSGTLLISNCLVIGNSAIGGSGGAAGQLSTTTFAGAGGIARGGAVLVSSGTLVLSGTILFGNSVIGGDGGSGAQFSSALGAPGARADGGAIFINTGLVTIVSCTLSNNVSRAGAVGAQSPSGTSGADASGGGIYANTATLNLINSTVCSNQVFARSGSSFYGNGGSGGQAWGGGLAAVGGNPGISGCTFFGNSIFAGNGGSATGTSGSGGGWGGDALGAAIFAWVGNLGITNSTISGNQAAGGGGGSGRLGTCGGRAVGAISTKGNGGLIQSCTIASNSAVPGLDNPYCSSPVPSTGGILSESSISLLNTIVAGNVTYSNSWDVVGSVTSLGFNLIGNSDGSSGWIASDLRGNSAALLDPKLGPLRNNGGLTWTLAPQFGSPALDNGKSAGLNLDQRGRQRPYDNPDIANAVDGDGTDIGAFEFQSPAPYITSIRREGGYIFVSLLTEVGYFYSLECSSVASASEPMIWTGCGQSLFGNGSNLQMVDLIDAGHLGRIYRARIW